MRVVITYLVLTLFLTTSSAQLSKEADLVNEITLIENGLLRGVQIEGERLATYTLEERMKHYDVPGISIAVVRDGKLHWAKGHGLANSVTETPVDQRTLFQAGSISKPVAALSVIKLWEEGLVDLDTDVNMYLRKWKVPENSFTEKEKVTLRRLITHNAGVTVHGFPGYAQTDAFPDDVLVLNGEGNTAKIEVDTTPGTIWRYSGGGYTIMENVVEDVTGQPFAAYMRRHVLEPLGMGYSTYEQPLPDRWHDIASTAYDGEGELYDGLWHNYPEQAAAGLWTNPTDLAYYCIEMQKALDGKSRFLTKGSAEAIMTKHENGWGLGPSLTGEDDKLLFRHGGKNAGFTNNFFAYAYGDDAAIVMTSADRGGDLIAEVMRALSKYYQWDTYQYKTISPVELDEEALSKFTGTFQYIEEVPGIGDYVMELFVEDGQLKVNDLPEESTVSMVPVSGEAFIDVENDDRVDFKMDGSNVSGFMWNNQYEFKRKN